MKIPSKVKSLPAFFNRNAWIICIIIGLFLNFTAECLQRHSFFEGLMHVYVSPLQFLFNTLIVTTVMSICTLFKRRNFLWAFFSAWFLGFAIANCVLLNLRVNPLEWADLQIVKISLITKYLNVFQIVLAVTPIVLAIITLIILFFKFPKVKVNYLKNGISAFCFIAVLLITLLVFRSNGILLSENSKNLKNSYQKYGFYYCFLCSAFDTGIDPPEVYEDNKLEEITKAINQASENNTALKEQADILQSGDSLPNIIFLQLETFFDVNHLSQVEFSENPIPNFTKLHNEYSSGYIVVPSIGAGTANTEFEVISGMSIDHFGMGEYPYKTVLQTAAGESICYNLKTKGYTAHAIHNNTATFYDRNTVFANLGFDTFTGLEHMQNVEFTSAGWAKDKVLIESITDALNSTDGSDLIYTISVQAHGKYPTEYNEKFPITSKGFSTDENINKAFNYYINQLNEVDMVLAQLLELLQSRDERTMVVMFGDHLPSFNITAADLESGNLFQTEYVIWDNFGCEKKDKNLNAYQLSSRVLEFLGDDSGVLTKLHQNFSQEEYYQEWLKTLEYDMLYGEKYAWGGRDKYPYVTTNLQMGIKEITVNEIEVKDNKLLSVIGQNYNEYSRIYINNKQIDTKFISHNKLVIESPASLKTGDLVTVGQISVTGNKLSSSKPYLIGGPQENVAEGAEEQQSKLTTSVEPSDTTEPQIIYMEKGFKLSTSIAIICICIAVVAVSIVIITVILIKRHYKKR